MNEYVLAPEQDVVISSRVRIARNYEDLPFPAKCSHEYSEEVIERTSDMVFSGSNGNAFSLVRMSELEQDARTRLVEHHLISYDTLKLSARSAAMISSAGTVSVMLNENDHLRFQGLLPGLQLERAAEMALRMDEAIGEKYPFAFDNQWGFLTARPADAGTGMRCSVIMHLPALAKDGRMGAIMQAVAKMGIAIRGLYGSGNEAHGQLYQLSNQATLGLSEEEIVHSLTQAAEQIAGHERTLRECAEKKDMMAQQDTLMRSWGEMMYARLLTNNEFMNKYSSARYAASMGYVRAPLPKLDLLMMDMQPGSLSVRAGKLIGNREAEILRAKIVREELKKMEENPEE